MRQIIEEGDLARELPFFASGARSLSFIKLLNSGVATSAPGKSDIRGEGGALAVAQRQGSSRQGSGTLRRRDEGVGS